MSAELRRRIGLRTGPDGMGSRILKGERNHEMRDL
jgi:hypothetical protein